MRRSADRVLRVVVEVVGESRKLLAALLVRQREDGDLERGEFRMVRDFIEQKVIIALPRLDVDEVSSRS